MGKLRATFRAAQEGDQSAVALLKEIALEGDTEAESLMMEQVRNVQLNTNFSFAEAFQRAIEAYPQLHLAYLNSNRV